MSEAERIARAYEDLETRAGARWNADNLGNQLILAERRRVTRELLERAGWVPLGDRRVLEVGSGGGSELAWLREVGAESRALVGVDLLSDRVASARSKYPELTFHQANAEHLEFADRSFDLVMALTVFSSIFDESMAANVASEMVRVVRAGGAVLWYDVRYYSNSNRNVHAVTAAQLKSLFPGLSGKPQTITLLPPLARRLGRAARVGYPLLSRLPPMRSHLIALLWKPAP